MDEARRNQLDVLEDIDRNGEQANTTSAATLTAEQASAAALGTPADAAAADDTGSASLISLTKRLLSKLPTLGAKNGAGSISVISATDDPVAANLGIRGDVSATSDTGSFTLISLFKRLLGKIPAVGTKTTANSLPVTLASDEALTVVHGTTADAAYTGGATASVIAALKGIYAKVAATLTVQPSKDQDPIFDNANGTKVAVGAAASTTILTPPAGCKYASVLVTNDGFFRCDAAAAGDLAGSQKLLANMERIIPVQAGVNVTFYSTVACTAYVVPFKDRP